MLSFLWTFAIVAFGRVLALNAEVGAFEALFLYTAYEFGFVVKPGQSNIAPSMQDRDEPYKIEEFLKNIAPQRKVLQKDEDGKSIPGSWTQLPRWDKVDWSLINKDPKDLEQIAYELINSNFTVSYANSVDVLASNPAGFESSLITQLGIVLNNMQYEFFGGELKGPAKELFEGKVKPALQAIGNAHRKAASEGLKKTLQEHLDKSGRNWKLFTKKTDKAPVRGFTEIDMDKTVKESGNAKDLTQSMKEYRMAGANPAANKESARLNRFMNRADILQKTLQTLELAVRRTCAV